MALLPAVPHAGVHPLHTSITNLTYDRTRHVATAIVRAFADDLARAVHGPDPARAHAAGAGVGAGVGTDDPAATIAYVRRALTILDKDGRPAPLTPCGIRSTGDLRWICFEAPLPGGLSGVRMGDAVLTDLYSDQVNVVTTDDGAHRTSALFTRGDGPKVVGPAP